MGFETCQFGTRVSTCYHVPRCEYQVAGDWSSPFGRWAEDPEFIADLQRIADADHARQSVCSWCRRPGEPYEYNGVRFDGLVACQGDRLCKRCADAYLENTPLLVEEVTWTGLVRSSRVYDLNPRTWDWSEENIPGCHGQPPVRAIAVDRHPEYADYVRPGRRRGVRDE